MDISTGKPVMGGHKHHLYAISEIMRAGSIRNAVEKGVIKSGIMYECVRNNIPFVLAGSIRDDGPLPDVISDVMTAQDAMREHIRGCSMVLMIATLLHSIAVGNCLPSNVKTVCVDINPAHLTSLMVPRYYAGNRYRFGCRDIPAPSCQTVRDPECRCEEVNIYSIF